ncbi:alpha/beta hydrolase [Massilia sp. B-10]|nr:alpha/beta hydrolase [Massilia sp. B-10]
MIALDVRGRGHSAHDPAPANYNPMMYAYDVIKLAHDLGIERAVFVGTSMGGIITMTLALRRLGLIAAAVLNDVGPVISEKGLARIAWLCLSKGCAPRFLGRGGPVHTRHQSIRLPRQRQRRMAQMGPACLSKMRKASWY